MSDENPMFRDPSYLGDGVYAGHDGYQIWLHTNHHANPTDRIALEPAVMNALILYAEGLRAKYTKIMETSDEIN